MKLTIILDDNIKIKSNIYWLLDCATEDASNEHRKGKLSAEGQLILEGMVRGNWKMEG